MFDVGELTDKLCSDDLKERLNGETVMGSSHESPTVLQHNSNA